MKISIAMATYNGSKYLTDQLQSFVDQTRLPDEVVITDDCSIDDTEEIVKEFSKTAPFEIRFYRNHENLGYSQNFNEALSRATGDFVFLSDQDDVWFSNKIETILETSSRDPDILAIMNDCEVTDSYLNPKGYKKYDAMTKAGLSDTKFVMGCCAAFKKSFLEIALPIPVECIGHDNWLVGLSDKLGSKTIVMSSLQYYRRHECNTSKQALNDERLSKFSFSLHKNFTLLKRYLKSSKDNNNLSKSIIVKELEILKLGEFLNSRANLDSEVIKLSILNCEEELGHLNKRSYIQKKPFIFRFFYASTYYCSGGYRNSLGLRSFLKDLF